MEFLCGSSSLFFPSSPPISISCFWWDLGMKDLTPLWFPLFFLSYSPINICCCVGIWEWRTWALRVLLPLHLHRFEPSTRIRGGDTCELVTLGSMDPRRLLWPAFCGQDLLWSRPFVVTWEPPIKLWVCASRLGSPQLSCGCVPQKLYGIRSPPQRRSIVEGELEPFVVEFIRRRRWAFVALRLTCCGCAQLSKRDVHLWVELGNTSSSPRASVISIPELLLMHFTL